MAFEGAPIVDSSDISDSFNKFLASKGSSLYSQLPSQFSNADASELRRNDSFFYLFPVGASDCEKNNCKPKKISRPI